MSSRPWPRTTAIRAPGSIRTCYIGKTRDQVLEKITALKAQDNQGIPTPDTNVKVAEYLTHWLAAVVKVNRRPRT